MERQLKTAMRFACPTSFDTRQTGNTLEAEIKLVTEREGLFDVSLAYENVVRLEDAKWVEDTITMPIFSRVHWRTFVRVEEGAWNLCSAQSELEKDGSSRGDSIRWYFVKVERVR